LVTGVSVAVVKYQEWTSGTYNWYSSNNSDTLGQIVNELKAWVTTINSNASQSGKHVAVLKDESSSTSSNYFGFTLSPADTSAISATTYFYDLIVTTTSGDVTRAMEGTISITPEVTRLPQL